MKLAILTLFAISVIITPYTAAYDVEAYKWSNFNENGVCVWDRCPDYIIKKMLEDMNGLYPPSYYKSQSWEWMRSTCTYSPEICE